MTSVIDDPVFVRSIYFQSCTSNPEQAFLFSAVSTKRASDHLLVDKMAAVPSDVYGHIYSFLVQQKFLKAAKAFKKEALVVSTIFRTFCYLFFLLFLKDSRIFIVKYPAISVHVLPTNVLVQGVMLAVFAKPADLF